MSIAYPKDHDFKDEAVANSVSEASPALPSVRGWVNIPAYSLLGYLILALVIVTTESSTIRVGLAISLALFGTGLSLVTVLFPSSMELDWAERAGLASGLSLAIGGLAGYLLAISPWGLRLDMFIVVNGVFCLCCYFFAKFRRRESVEPERSKLPWLINSVTTWWVGQSILSRLITVGLLAFMISGAWSLNRATLKPASEPAMTEFFLLDRNGYAEEFPDTAMPGETITVGYGIINREEEAAGYQVHLLIAGKLEESYQTVNLKPGETYEAMTRFEIPEELEGMIKVDFALFQDDDPIRLLHIFVDVENDQLNTS